MKSKSLLQEIMTSFVNFDVQLKHLVSLQQLNQVKSTARRIANLMCFGTYVCVCVFVLTIDGTLQLLFNSIPHAVTVLLGSLFIGLHSIVMIDAAHIWTVFYFISFTISKLGILLYDFQFVNCLLFVYKRIAILSDCVG